MKEEYPNFNDKDIRYEYTNKINNLFKQNNFNWSANPALLSPHIYVKPDNPSIDEQLNSGALPFTDIARISLNTKEGIARLGIMAYPSINSSTSKKSLEERGYITEAIEGHPGIFFLVKPLKKLKDVVVELRNLEPILAPKHL